MDKVDRQKVEKQKCGKEKSPDEEVGSPEGTLERDGGERKETRRLQGAEGGLRRVPNGEFCQKRCTARWKPFF